MALGDMFANMAEDDPMAAVGALAATGKVAVGDPGGAPSRMHAQEAQRALEQAQFQKEQDARRRQQQKAGAAIVSTYEAEKAARDKMVSQYGTDDPELAARIKATGVFDSDLNKQMQLDPEGTPQRVKRAFDMLGIGGAADAPVGPAQPTPTAEGRTYKVGVGAHGEPYYTNLTRTELHQERQDVSGITKEETPPPVTDLKVLGLRDKPTAPGTAAEETDPAKILFAGKVAEARMIAERPQREAEHGVKLLNIQKELFDLGKREGADVARQEVVDRLMRGEFRSPQEAARLDANLARHAFPTLALADKMQTDPLAMPLTKAGKKPGVAGDKGEPSTVLNPLGGKTDEQYYAEELARTKGDNEAYITNTTPAEQPRTFAYATGRVPSPATTPVPTRGAPSVTATSQDLAERTLEERRKKRAREAAKTAEYALPGGAMDPLQEIFGFTR